MVDFPDEFFFLMKHAPFHSSLRSNPSRRVAEQQVFGRRDRGSKPPLPFRSLGNFVRLPYFACLSKKTVKAVGLFYLMSMPGEVKDPKH